MEICRFHAGPCMFDKVPAVNERRLKAIQRHTRRKIEKQNKRFPALSLTDTMPVFFQTCKVIRPGKRHNALDGSHLRFYSSADERFFHFRLAINLSSFFFFFFFSTGQFVLRCANVYKQFV